MALTLQQLQSACLADWQFFRNTILDFSGTEALDRTITTPWIGAVSYVDAADRSVGQSVALGLPCVTVDRPDQYITPAFGFLANTAFSIEYLGIPGRHSDYTDASHNLSNGEIYLYGNGPSYIRLTYLVATGFHVEVNLGVARATPVGHWWQDRSPLHLIVSRATNGVITAYVQGVQCIAGAAGACVAIANPVLFNLGPPVDNVYAFEGCHHRVRMFNTTLDTGDARYLFQQAQNLLPAAKFPMPYMDVTP